MFCVGFFSPRALFLSFFVSAVSLYFPLNRTGVGFYLSLSCFLIYSLFRLLNGMGVGGDYTPI